MLMKPYKTNILTHINIYIALYKTSLKNTREINMLRVRSEGSECVYMQNKITIYDEDDGTKKLIIGVMDVTESKKAEVALKKPMQQRPAFCSILDYIAVGIATKAMISLIGLHTGVLIIMKRTFAEAFTINLKPHTFRQQHALIPHL